MDLIASYLNDTGTLIVLGVVFVTGIVRGFSGFGSGMIIGPTTAALFTPKIALAMIAVLETLPTLQLVWTTRRNAVWSQLIPIVIGYAALAGLGIWVLATSDPTVLRWFICLSIFAAVSLLWTGWTYHGPRTPPISLGVGAAGGFMGAAAALPGPPVLLYWMSGGDRAATIRANMIYYLFLTDIIIIIGYLIAGIFTQTAVILGVLAMPGYMVGILIGTKFFTGASETTYRRVAFTIILVAAISSLPLLDPMLRQ